MTDIIIAIFIISIPFGLARPTYGSFVGLILSIGYCFFSKNIDLYVWFAFPFFSSFLGYVFPLIVRWFFSGYRGGRGKTEPGVTYIGGFGLGRAGQYFGKWSEGIIPTENEEAGWIEDKKESRERWIGILIRYLSVPIVLILAFIAFELLH